MRIRRDAYAYSLVVNWAHDLYVVTQGTLDSIDHKRQCWICSGSFVLGDGMTIVSTDEGNKTTHTKCYHRQIDQAYPIKGVYD